MAGADSALMRPESEFAYGRVGTKALCARGTPLWASKGEGCATLTNDSEADEDCSGRQRRHVLVCNAHSPQRRLIALRFEAMAFDLHFGLSLLQESQNGHCRMSHDAGICQFAGLAAHCTLKW